MGNLNTSGIDSGKKVKGIRRQLATDKNGFPPEIIITTANVHDVCGGEQLVVNLISEFRPIQGRRVVERTFSWLQNYRRLMRNYEQHLHTARAMALLASVFFMLRHFD